MMLTYISKGFQLLYLLIYINFTAAFIGKLKKKKKKKLEYQGSSL